MDFSTVELARAKQAVSTLLQELGLSAYLFEVEPGPDRWEVRVECAIQGGWQALVLRVDKDELLASAGDAQARARVLSAWQPQLAACRCEPGGPPS